VDQQVVIAMVVARSSATPAPVTASISVGSTYPGASADSLAGGFHEISGLAYSAPLALGTSVTATGNSTPTSGSGTFINAYYISPGDVSTDPNNCGLPGNVCPSAPNGTPVCSNSVCGLTCNTGYTLNGSACVNTVSDPANCGTIGYVCPGTSHGSAICVNSVCGLTCNAGYSLSGSACVNTMSDPANCGTVGHACASGASCVNGACACSAPKTSCPGSCVDTSVDANNCGACGFSCGAGNFCSDSMCFGPGWSTQCSSANACLNDCNNANYSYGECVSGWCDCY
jgi:hypothetical protein